MDMHADTLIAFWKLRVTGVIHAGAHKGEERVVYSRLNFGPVTWIEAMPHLASELRSVTVPPHRVINATLWSHSNECKSLKIMTSSASSSLFDVDLHKIEYPEIRVLREIEVLTKTLDEIALDPKSNLLVLDLQGAEYEALIGAKRMLESIEYILTEVNRKKLYKDIKLVSEIDSILSESQFRRVATRWTRHGWGEALYLRLPESRVKLMSEVRLEIQIVVFWVWLHLFEIPGVFVRQKFRKAST